jgi:hypothetical protein
MIACGARESGAAEVWAPAEPVFPADEAFPAWNAFSLTSGGIGLDAFSPSSWGALCGENGSPGSGIATLDSACAARRRAHPLEIRAEAGAYPLNRPRGAFAPFEAFNSGWGSIRVDPELGARWNALPPLAAVALKYPVTPHSIVAFRMGLHRDLSAWSDDPGGSNVPLSDKEVDLNEPSLGYFRAESERFAFTIGRFPVHWSPSPEYGLALSSAVPYHNGAEFALKLPRFRYRFLVSSLNPWLAGTPAGDTSSEDYPPGSEEYRQRHYPSSNGASLFHHRVYDARIKTLFAHRIEGDLGPVSLGATETQIIGGKPPDLRDAGPFILFHNDFKEGFANGALSLDASVRLPRGVRILGEYYIDDVNYSETEKDGNTASLHGWMLGLRHAFTARGWLFGHGLHAIRTDPYLYGYLQPLNTMASRIVLASNNQHSGDPVFVDKYVIDYPVGYLRGGDAFDFRYRLDAWRGAWHWGLAADALAKGEVDLYTPYETYYQASHEAPSGTAEREFRLRLETEWKPVPGLGLRAGAGWGRILDEGHEAGRDRDEARAACGVAWAFPH